MSFIQFLLIEKKVELKAGLTGFYFVRFVTSTGREIFIKIEDTFNKTKIWAVEFEIDGSTVRQQIHPTDSKEIMSGVHDAMVQFIKKEKGNIDILEFTGTGFRKEHLIRRWHKNLYGTS